MHPLSAPEIVHIWEVGVEQHLIDRALTILAAAFPEMPRDELATLSVGQRDARLLAVREWTFGPQLSGYTECPECQKPLELSLHMADIQVAPAVDQTDQVHQMAADGWELHFRLPNSLDLAAITSCGDVASARNLLVRRCVVQARQGGAEVSTEALPEAVAAALAAQVIARDPQAEVDLNLGCIACGHRWQMTFEIALFFWSEINAEAKRLLREVHTLARSYGWCEADILSMSAMRRRFYMEMVT